MKKFSLLIGLLSLSIPLFAGGGKQAAAASVDQGGLTTLKVWGPNKEATQNQQHAKVSDFLDGTVKSRIWDKFNDELAKRGIKLDWTLIMPDQVSTAFQTLLASGQFNQYDWIGGVPVDALTRYSLVEQGRLYPINKAIDQYSSGTAKNYIHSDTAGRHFAAVDTLSDGNFYWLTQHHYTYNRDPSKPLGIAIIGLIREDWLRKFKLPMPKTLDEFYNTIVYFQQNDANENGIKDEVIKVETSGFGYGINTWFGLGTSLVSVIDYKAVSPWYQPHVKDYFVFMNKLYKAGLLQMIYQDAYEDTAVASNMVSFLETYAPALGVTMNIRIPEGQGVANLVPLVIQAYPDTQPRVFHAEHGYSQWWDAGMYSIPASTKNIEKLVAMIDYFEDQSYSLLTFNGIEGYSYNLDEKGNPIMIRDKSNRIGVDAASDAWMELWAGWEGVFPRFGFVDRNLEIEDTRLWDEERRNAEGWKPKEEFFTKFENNSFAFSLDLASTLAYPTVKEVERLAQLTPDLDTYSSELITGLILGEKSLDNWDAYVADLKRLGLDELISIYQARVDRAR